MRKTILTAVMVALGVMGCAGGADAPFAEAAPADLSALSLEISGADEGTALTATDGVQRDGLDATPEGLRLARDRVKALNEAVRAVVTRVAELTATAGHLAPGDVATFGPKTRNGVEYTLTVKRLARERFVWKLSAKAAGASDATVVAAGSLTRGQLPHRGRGALGIDFDALRAIDTSITPAGKLFCGFAHVGDTKSLVYNLKGFTPNPANVDPMSAHFVGHRLMPSRATAVRVIAKVNIKDSPTPAEELVRARIRYVPGLGGRAAFLATGGDVPADKVFIGHACWDAQEQEGFAIVRSCQRGVLPSDATCNVIATRGQLGNCRIGELAAPAEDVDDASAEDEAPATDVVAPADMPAAE